RRGGRQPGQLRVYGERRARRDGERDAAGDDRQRAGNGAAGGADAQRPSDAVDMDADGFWGQPQPDVLRWVGGGAGDRGGERDRDVHVSADGGLQRVGQLPIPGEGGARRDEPQRGERGGGVWLFGGAVAGAVGVRLAVPDADGGDGCE